MTSTKRKAANIARRREAEARAARTRTRTRIAVGGIMAVVVALAAMVLTKVVMSASDRPASTEAGSANSVTLDAFAVPATTLDTVGRGSVQATPKSISGAEALTRDAKPLVLYVGAEYCPFCAAQRWALVVALNRFGSFTNLRSARSALDDVYPGTATVSFFGATYASPYLAFEGVELATSVRRGDEYTPLQSLTPEQERVVRRFNAPPYVPAASAGAVPFLDLGNRFLMSGAGFSPAVLAGQSHDQIVAQLSRPDTATAKAVVGSANSITAALCVLTNGQPRAVCDSPAVKAFDGTDNG